jgi:4-hydroxybenzoate synthetase (chorismate lyase)
LHRPDSGWIAHPFSAPRAIRGWLADRGSLTRRLKARCAQFGVRPVATGNARAHRDEHRCLHLRAGSVQYRRDVVLVCNGCDVVYAHSVLPRAGLRGGWNRITHLGSRPLGEALFNDHRVSRKTLSYRRLDARDPLFIAASRVQTIATRSLWARRSVFCLNGHALMVSEVFLWGFTDA